MRMIDIQELAKKQGEAFRQHGNIYIIGIPGVGKSTMGTSVAKHLEIPTIDLEFNFLGFYARINRQTQLTPLQTIDKAESFERTNEVMRDYILRKMAYQSHSVIMMSYRVMDFPEVWQHMYDHGVVLMLQGMPLEIYERRAQRNLHYLEKKELTDKELEEHIQYLYCRRRKIYFSWKHCWDVTRELKANYFLRVRGEMQPDMKALRAKILAIQAHLSQGGSPPLRPFERGLGFHPQWELCREFGELSEKESKPHVSHGPIQVS